MADGVAGSNSDRWNWQLCCLQPIGDSPPAEGAKQDSDSISHAGKSDDLVSANGTVQPESSVNVSPKTSGVLKQLLVKEGEFVQAGQVVAYMDNSNLQGQLLQARGNLAAAEANLNKVIAGNRSQDIA